VSGKLANISLKLLSRQWIFVYVAIRDEVGGFDLSLVYDCMCVY